MADDTKDAKFELELAKHADQIVKLYRAGVPASTIAKKYDAYSADDIELLVQQRVSLSNINWDILDANLLNGYLEDMQAVQDKIIDKSNDSELALKGYLFKLNARNYAVKFRAILSDLQRGPNPGSGGEISQNSTGFSSQSDSKQQFIFEEVRRKLTVLSPEKRLKAIEILESHEREGAQKLLEAGIFDDPSIIEGELKS